MNIIKRNGTEVIFNPEKIFNAVMNAKNTTANAEMTDEDVRLITDSVISKCVNLNRIPDVEMVQDLVEAEILTRGFIAVGQHYIKYRYDRELRRKANSTDKNILSLLCRNNEEAKSENANKNPSIVSVQRDYMAGEVSKDISRRFLLDQDIIDAHDAGIIHFHDMDYFAQPIHNCGVYNLEDMLQNGTVISGTYIEPPKSFATACTVATQLIAQIASCSYGGQSFSLAHLSPFVEASRQKHRKQVREELEASNVCATDDQINEIAELRTKQEVISGIQTIQYQVITLQTTNGQAPFVTVFMYLNEVPEGQPRNDLAMCIEAMLNQRIKGVQTVDGAWVTPAFPKLIYVTSENNVRPDSEYYELTCLAAKCTAKRMVPDYVSEKIMKDLKLSKGEKPGEGDVYGPMGCRSFLTPDRSGNGFDNIANAGNYDPDKPKYYGRFNQGVVTINLVDAALSSGKDEKEFWKILDQRLELCHRALQARHQHLLNTPSDVAPILWQYGAIARLEKGELINPLLYGGYSTISLGYAGVYEMCRYMKGVSHTDPKGKEFSLKVMDYLNNACQRWKIVENIDYSVYGTPMESTTYKFAKCLQKRFGKIPEVTDHSYITNSYHVNVREEIDAFSKLEKEAEFQRLSPGGAISYVEIPNMQNNIPAVLKLIEFIHDTIMYAELNIKSDYCQECGY